MSRFFTWFPSRCPQNTNCRQKLTSRERPGRCPFNHVTKVNVASEGTNQKHASPEGLCYSRLRCVICSWSAAGGETLYHLLGPTLEQWTGRESRKGCGAVPGWRRLRRRGDNAKGLPSSAGFTEAGVGRECAWGFLWPYFKIHFRFWWPVVAI